MFRDFLHFLCVSSLLQITFGDDGLWPNASFKETVIVLVEPYEMIEATIYYL